MDKPKFDIGQEVSVDMFGTISGITIQSGFDITGKRIETLQYMVKYDRVDGRPGDMCFVLEDSLCKLPLEE